MRGGVRVAGEGLMKRIVLALPAILLAMAVSAWAADGQSGSIERFVELVAAGRELAGTEYADLVSAEDAAELRGLAQCAPGAPRYSETNTSAIILWDCSGQSGRRNLATMFGLSEGRVVDVALLPAVVVPVRPQS